MAPERNSARPARNYLLTGTLGPPGATSGAHADYEIVHGNGRRPKNPTRARPLATGGSSVVYRARFRQIMERAIKVLDPRPDLAASQDPEQFHRTFQEEIRILAGVTHTNIGKLTDFGRWEMGDEIQRYYVMDLVEGVQFQDYWRRDECTASQFIHLLHQVLEGAAYLHHSRIMHCDLKAENVLVKPAMVHVGSRALAVIVDLGVAKAFPTTRRVSSQARLPIESRDTTYFYSTERITIPALVPYLSNRRGIPVEREFLRGYFPKHDLYSLSIMLEEALASGMREKLEDAFGPAVLQALELIRLRLRGDYGEYENAAEALRDLEKIEPTYLFPLGLPEMGVVSGTARSVTTPGGAVALTGRMLRIVDHPMFQRLHLMPQLELLHHVYPGARHTRFLQSLDTFEMTRKYVTRLLIDPRFLLLVEPHDIEALLTLALLRDVGHYPLAHMFEDFVASERRHWQGGRRIPSNEELFWMFANLDPASNAPGFDAAFVENVVRLSGAQASATGALPFPDLVRRTFRKQVVDTLCAIGRHANDTTKVLAGVLSSRVDAYKAAYLTVDSLMTGAPYAKGIDLEGLMSSLVCPSVDDLKGGGQPALGIRERGVAAAESMVLARYWMIRRVYWHHTNRALMAAFKYVIALLVLRGAFAFTRYLEANLAASEHEAARWLHDAVEAFRASPGASDQEQSMRNPLAEIVRGERLVYKRLVTLEHGDPTSESLDHQLYMAIEKRSPDELLHLVHELGDIIAPLTPGHEVRRGDALIDLPLRNRELSGGLTYVYDDFSGAPLGELLQVSPLLRSWQSEYEKYAKKCRIFIHPEVEVALGGAVDSARHEVRAWLAHRLGVS